MYSVSQIIDSIPAFAEALKAQEELTPLLSKASCTAILASFLVITSLIVIVAGTIVAMQNGVNVINDVFWPAYVPASFGLLLSAPLIYRSVKLHEKRNQLWAQSTKQMKEALEKVDFASIPRESEAEPVDALFPKDIHHMRKRASIQELIQSFPKPEERTQEQGRIINALEESARNLLPKSKRNQIPRTKLPPKPEGVSEGFVPVPPKESYAAAPPSDPTLGYFERHQDLIDI